MSKEIELIGREQFLERFNTGKPLAPLLTDLANDALQGYPWPLAGAWDAATGCLDHIQGRRLVRWSGDAAGWTGRQFRREGNRLLHLRRYDEFSRLVGLLCGMLEGARAAAHKPLRLQFETKEAPPPPPPPAPPPPMKVEVVSLPPRVTTTQIERDAEGNIASAAQVERDL